MACIRVLTDNLNTKHINLVLLSKIDSTGKCAALPKNNGSNILGCAKGFNLSISKSVFICFQVLGSHSVFLVFTSKTSSNDAQVS